MWLTSLNRGGRSMVTGSAVSRAAAITGSTAFLAAETRASPFSLFSPSM